VRVQRSIRFGSATTTGAVSRMNCSSAATTAAASSGEADGATIVSCGRRFTRRRLALKAAEPIVDQRRVPLVASIWDHHIAGLVVWSVLMLALWRRAWRQPKRLARATDVVGALVCAALVVFGIANWSPDRPRSVWDTDQGRQMQAGFLDACRHGAYGPVACDCLFDELTSRATAATASGFTMLTQSIQYATLRGDASLMSQPAAAAMDACRREA